MPLTVTPSGSLSLPFSSLATLVASSATYQELANAGSAAAALDTVHYPYVDLSDPPPLTFSLISDYDALSQRKARNTNEESGELLWQIFALPNLTAYGGDYSDPRDILLDFRNKVGAVLQEMMNNARNPDGAGGTYFGMTDWEKHDTPQLVKRQDTDLVLTHGGNAVTEFLFAGFRILWNS